MTMHTHYYQTITGTGDNEGTPAGNCMVASVATITGTDIAQVPHFVETFLASNRSIGHGAVAVHGMTQADWLTVLADVITWLDTEGYDTEYELERPRPAIHDLYGETRQPRLALVMSRGTDPQPHIIIVDQQWMHWHDPNPANQTPYRPTDVQAAIVVTKR